MPWDPEVIHPGMPVLDVDGLKVGVVEHVDDAGFLVERGVLFPTDFAVPFTAVLEVRDDAVVLPCSKRALLADGEEALIRATTRTTDDTRYPEERPGITEP